MGRTARIGTTALGYYGDKAEGWRRALELAEAAGQSGCDLVLLPEALYSRSDDAQPEQEALLVMREQLSEIARRHSMYVMAGMHAWEDDVRFNCAVLFGRSGDVTGTYRKIHPTEGEIRSGVAPGTDLPVFDLDFGRVGAMVCFDIGWPDEWARLAEKGAEMVCWLSAYDGGFPLQAYAWTNRYYVVSSVRSTEAKFIDVTGAILSRTSRWTRLCIDELNLDRELFHIDQNWDRLAAVQARYGDSVGVRGFSEENLFTLDPLGDLATLEEVKREFRLERYDAYHGRVTLIQDEARHKLASGR